MQAKKDSATALSSGVPGLENDCFTFNEYLRIQLYAVLLQISYCAQSFLTETPLLYASGLGLMYVSFAAAIAAWILAGVCFAGFCAVKILAWYYHG